MPRQKNWPACVVCGKPREETTRISTRGKCDDCGEGRAVAEVRQLRAHNGPWFDHWRRRTLAAFGVVTDTDD